MKFKELDIYGFKSFADKLKVQFGSGITAIVGPNGCGKSNVADAVRWVLGEQSAKLLRGKNMMDVIFSGTEKRKSLSFCEVVLHFDNTERMFASLPYNEVTISRKLYRSGESQYFINDSQCKLKDINDLIRDGGMGREGYSIIGQGRIDELLSAKPENRRAIFEEAAGISKFKFRKTEAERKLERTRSNMELINVILSEKQQQLDPLSNESEKAKKFLDLRDRLKNHEINIFLYERDSSETAKQNLSQRLDAAKEELAVREKDFASIMQEYKTIRDKYESSDADMACLRNELMLHSVNMEKISGEINSRKQQQDFLRQTNQNLFVEINSLESELSTTNQQLETFQNENQDAVGQIEKQRIEYEQKNNEYLSVVDILTAHAGKAEEERRSEIEAMDRLSEIKANLSSLKAEEQILSETTGASGQKIEQISQLLEEKNSSHLLLSEEVDKLLIKKEGKIDEFEKKNKLFLQLKSISDKLYDDIADNNRSFYTISTRYRMLKDLKDTHEGFGVGVKNLLREAKSSPILSQRIEGVFAELIKVEKIYETAIEVALGGAYQNVVVRNENDANFLIDFLKKNRLGRVTFMPISSAKPRELDGRFHSLLSLQGCYGVASDIINFDEKYRRVVEGFLGSTVIVENKEVATEIFRESRAAFKIVTLDGEVFAANGSITGGSLKSDKSIANIFSHERELNQLEPELIRLEKEKAEFSEEKKKYDNKLLLLREELDDSKSEIHQFELLITSKMEGVNQLFAEKEKLSQELKGLKQQHETDMNRLVKIEDDLSSVSKLEEFLAEKRKKASESGQEATQFVQDLREKSDLLRLQCNELRINLGKLESTLQFVCENLDRLTSRAGEIKEKLENSKQIKETNIYIIGKLEEEINLLINKNDFGDSEKSNQLAKKISEMEESKRVMAARIDEIDNQRETLSGKLQQLRDKKTHLDYQLQNVDNEIDNKEQRIFEEYNLDYSECLAFKQTDYDALRGSQEATKLKKGIQSLGDVNVGAIESYKEASEKYNEFLSSREDLVRAESDLVKIIKDLSSDMLKIFNENFEKTRVNFVKIFKELFDGGDADLLLIEDEDGDPLSRGIDIVAQPPQKKLQNISLLSGGERALTAIAILFAILKLRPMPFCVLDEIEAALDDANASRFAKYLRRFSEETQFIVITHRKPTMELADSLYGVTMEEKGVSKIVSVKLSDAVAQSVDSIGA